MRSLLLSALPASHTGGGGGKANAGGSQSGGGGLAPSKLAAAGEKGLPTLVEFSSDGGPNGDGTGVSRPSIKAVLGVSGIGGANIGAAGGRKRVG